MQRLFQGVKIQQPGSEHHQQVHNILVEDGVIKAIGPEVQSDHAETIDMTGYSVSTGWIDLEAECGDPGYEQHEDLHTLCRAAATGGFTQVGLRPHAHPVIHNKSGVNYLLQQTAHEAVDILPLGALSHNLEGKDITEMLDMHRAGAVAFTDGEHSIQHAGLMLRVLQYAKAFDGLVMQQPLDKSIAGQGQLHEGVISTQMGTRGIPALAETMVIARDLRLLAYADSRLHFSHLSTAEGVALVRKAKAAGLRVTASVAALNLLATIEDVQGFASNYKVHPPLRSQADRQALIEGLSDGTIDCISSNHVPRNEEHKALEFAYADFGAAMLSTAFAAVVTGIGDSLTEEEVIAKMTTGPASVFKLQTTTIAVDEPARLTFYDYQHEWTPTLKDIASKSKNSPLIGRQLRGRAIGVLNGEKWVSNFINIGDN